MDETDNRVIEVLKRLGSASAGEVAMAVGISRQAARTQLEVLVAAGHARAAPDRAAKPGRPVKRYALTMAGEGLFPKRYAELALTLIDAIGERHGSSEVDTMLEHLVEAKVRRWTGALDGLAVPERLERLRNIYVDGDPWVEVAEDDRGWKLVEWNCPYLEVAAARPALCALTVNVLSRLVGRRVVREERFQAGDGRCVFRVLDEACPDGFVRED